MIALPHSKMKIAVGVALGLGAIAFIIHAHNASAQAAAAATNADVGTGFPTLLYTSGAGSAQIATGGQGMTDTTVGQTSAPDTATGTLSAALAAATAQINSAASQTYNTNFTDLFASLPDTIAHNNLDGLNFTGSQGNGTTSLIASVHYRDNAPLVNVTPPTPAPAPVVNAAPAAPATIDANATNAINSYLSATASNAGAVRDHHLDLVSALPAIRQNVALPSNYTNQQLYDGITHDQYWNYIGAYYHGY